MRWHQPVCPLPHLLVMLAAVTARDPPGPVAWQGTGRAPVLLLPTALPAGTQALAALGCWTIPWAAKGEPRRDENTNSINAPRDLCKGNGNSFRQSLNVQVSQSNGHMPGGCSGLLQSFITWEDAADPLCSWLIFITDLSHQSQGLISCGCCCQEENKSMSMSAMSVAGDSSCSRGKPLEWPVPTSTHPHVLQDAGAHTTVLMVDDSSDRRCLLGSDLRYSRWRRASSWFCRT